MLVEDMLGDLGCAIAGIATSAVEAESIARTALIDFALLDVNLDGETSFAAADVLRRREIPFAFVTGYGEQGVRGDLRNAPILSKPIDPRHLARVISAIDRD
jgi:CheY-like chemotaxis protein